MLLMGVMLSSSLMWGMGFAGRGNPWLAGGALYDYCQKMMSVIENSDIAEFEASPFGKCLTKGGVALAEKCGFRPLHIALEANKPGSIAVVDFLLRKGARLDLTEHQLEDPLG